jgi:hypothetical protein
MNIIILVIKFEIIYIYFFLQVCPSSLIIAVKFHFNNLDKSFWGRVIMQKTQFCILNQN